MNKMKGNFDKKKDEPEFIKKKKNLKWLRFVLIIFSFLDCD